MYPIVDCGVTVTSIEHTEKERPLTHVVTRRRRIRYTFGGPARRGGGSDCSGTHERQSFLHEKKDHRRQEGNSPDTLTDRQRQLNALLVAPRPPITGLAEVSSSPFIICIRYTQRQKVDVKPCIITLRVFVHYLVTPGAVWTAVSLTVRRITCRVLDAFS